MASVGNVILGNNSHVSGHVVTSGSVTAGIGAIVDRAISERANLTPVSTTSFDGVFPAGACQTLVLGPGTTANAPPGRYCRIQVKARATLNLRSGNYYVDTLDPVEPEARLNIDDASGPVRIFLKSTFAFRGSLASASSVPDVLFGVLVGGMVSVESAFSGTIVAPAAVLSLSASGKTLTGSFFALDIIVHSDVKIKQHSVSDLRKCDDGNACTRRDSVEHGVCVGHDPVLFGLPESDASAPGCPDGTKRLGCRGFDCITGLPTTTWLAAPTCGSVSCNASCPATGCTPENRRNGSVLECPCTCTDPTGGPPLTLRVQACGPETSLSCSAICARAESVCDAGVSCEVGTCTAASGSQPTKIIANGCRLNDQGATSTTSPFTAGIDARLSRVDLIVGGRRVSAPVTGSIGFSIRSNPDGEVFGLSSFSGSILAPVDVFGRQIDLVEAVTRQSVSGRLTKASQGDRFTLALGPNDLAARAVIDGVPRFVSLDAAGTARGTLTSDRRTVTFATEVKRINGDRIALNITARTSNFPPRPTIFVTPGTSIECSGQRAAPVSLRASVSDPNPGDVVTRFQWVRRDPQAIDRQLSALGAGYAIETSLPVGASEVSVIAYDDQLAAGRAQVVVTVRDTVAPAVISPPDRTVYAGDGASSVTVNLGSATISDLCDPSPQRQALLGEAIVVPGAAVLPIGTSIVTWRAMDSQGNVGSASQRVTVLAEGPPEQSEAVPPSEQEGCAQPFTPPGSPEVQVDVSVCLVGRINAGIREGAAPFEDCADDMCTDQRVRDMLAGANIFFRGFVRFNSLGFKRIRDPAPPSQNEECSTTNYGDVCIIDTLGGSGGREADTMRNECFAAWGFPSKNSGDACRRTVTLTLMRASRTNGICGVALAAHTPNPTNCADPTTVPDNTSGAFAMAHTNTFGFSAASCDPVTTVAHELGHALGLQHGDGLDNNCNGVWDDRCDTPLASPEIDDGPVTLMHPYGSTGPLTRLQTDRAQVFATKSVPAFAPIGDNCVAPPLPVAPADTVAPPPQAPSGGCGCSTAAPEKELVAPWMLLFLLLVMVGTRTRKPS